MQPDEVLLKFDTSRLAGYSQAMAEEALTQHGEVYRSHLLIAYWIDEWIVAMGEDRTLAGASQEGFVRGLREVAGHLRQADFLPGGALNRENLSPGSEVHPPT